jgi:hypothetical protein
VLNNVLKPASVEQAMDALKTRLTEVVGQFFSQSPLTEAINYTLNRSIIGMV